MLEHSDKTMKEIDKKLQEIAVNDWQEFVNLIGRDKLLAAKIRLLRQGGNSYGKIQRKLHLTKNKVQYVCNNREG